MTSRASFALSTLLALAAWTAAAPLVRAQDVAPGPAVASPLEAIADPERRAIFEQVWQTIRDRHFDKAKTGADWDAVLRKYAPQAARAANDRAFYGVINAMLGELGQSHCAASPAGTHKRAERAAGAEPADPTLREMGETGIEIRLVEGFPTVVAVAPDSPAAEAGVRPGAILQAVDGNAIDPAPAADAPYRDRVEWVYGCMGMLSGPAGQPAVLTLAEGPDQPGKPVTVGRRAAPTSSLGYLEGIPAGFSTRVLEGGVAYLRLGSFFMPVFQQFQAAMGSLGTPAGLVIDLRGNPGGIAMIAPGMIGFLTREKGTLGTSKMREGELRYPVFPRKNAYAGPLAVLIDEASASTSEIFAAGIRETGRGRVFGRRTAGMVLPSVVYRLPDGGVLQFPMADFETAKGARLEGNGVEPDVAVEWTREACAAGRDPALEAALAWLKETSQH